MVRTKRQEKRDEFVTFRAGPTFKSKIEARAAAEHRTVSSWVQLQLASMLKNDTKTSKGRSHNV
jgi:hypothetical protein